MILSWDSPRIPNTNDILTYTVYVTQATSADQNQTNTTNTILHWDVSNPNDRICFQVSASNSEGEGPKTNNDVCNMTSAVGMLCFLVMHSVVYTRFNVFLTDNL